MPDMVRSFIAISLTDDAKSALSRVADKLRRAPGGQIGRWVRTDDIHLTLRFLGDVPADDVPVIGAALEEVCTGYPAFELTLAGLGCFPNTRAPRVVWVGIQEEGHALSTLQQAVEQAVEALGFPPEDRPFSPHLTLARVNRDARREEIATLGRTVEGMTIGELARVPVEAVYLIRSDLRPTGPMYTPLSTAPLKQYS